MRLIRCTQKLLRELSFFPAGSDVAEINPEGLGNWYANLVRFDRRKCFIFTNEKTLYSFLVPGVLKKDLLNIHNLFRSHLSNNLQYEGFATDVIKRALEEYNEIGLAKTASRSVLGSMNDLKCAYGFEVVRSGGIGGFNVLAVNREMNRTPLSAIKYSYAIEEVKRVIVF